MYFGAAINLDPTNPTYLWQRASVYCEMNENKKAIESFELLLKVSLE
jgi:tetratricopeptide (TPR) repeat protein